jgi:hypothetical protein
MERRERLCKSSPNLGSRVLVPNFGDKLVQHIIGEEPCIFGLLGLGLWYFERLLRIWVGRCSGRESRRRRCRIAWSLTHVTQCSL